MKSIIILFLFASIALGQVIDVGGTGGNGIVSVASGVLWIDTTNPATSNGVIDSVSLRFYVAASADTLWIAVGTYSANTYTVRDWTYTVCTGTNHASQTWPHVLASPLTILSGDVIATWTDAVNAVTIRRSNDGSGLGLYYKVEVTNPFPSGTISTFTSAGLNQSSAFGYGYKTVSAETPKRKFGTYSGWGGW